MSALCGRGGRGIGRGRASELIPRKTTCLRTDRMGLVDLETIHDGTRELHWLLHYLPRWVLR